METKFKGVVLDINNDYYPESPIITLTVKPSSLELGYKVNNS